MDKGHEPHDLRSRINKESLVKVRVTAQMVVMAADQPLFIVFFSSGPLLVSLPDHRRRLELGDYQSLS
jgi:hypothetical protein